LPKFKERRYIYVVRSDVLRKLVHERGTDILTAGSDARVMRRGEVRVTLVVLLVVVVAGSTVAAGGWPRPRGAY
jgi:hypothetical protein